MGVPDSDEIRASCIDTVISAALLKRNVPFACKACIVKLLVIKMTDRAVGQTVNLFVRRFRTFTTFMMALIARLLAGGIKCK